MRSSSDWLKNNRGGIYATLGWLAVALLFGPFVWNSPPKFNSRFWYNSMGNPMFSFAVWALTVTAIYGGILALALGVFFGVPRAYRAATGRP